jgi:hypothetical protein
LAWNWDEMFFESTRGRMVTLLRRSGRTVEELARARWHCAAARFGTPCQRWRKAGLRLRAEIGSRRTVPEGLRTGARPAPGCSGRAPWTRGIGGVTEVGRSSLGGGQDRNERRHSRPARGSRRRARSPAAASRWRQPMRLLKDSYACWELSSTAADQSKG